MLSEHRRAFSNTMRLLDLLVVVGAVALAAPRPATHWSDIAATVIELSMAAIVWLSLSSRAGLYHSRRTGSLLTEVWLLVCMLGLSAGIALMARVLVGLPPTLDLALLAGIGLGGTAGVRLTVRPALSAMRRRGLNTRRYLFVGRGDSAQRIASAILSHPDYGIQIVGALTFSGEETRLPVAGVTDLGGVAEMQDVLRQHAIDDIVVCPSDCVWATEVKSLLRFAQTTGISVRLAPDCFGIPVESSVVQHIGHVPTYAIVGGFGQQSSLWAKRLIDVVGSGIGLLLLTPLMLLIAAAIKLTSQGPIFFRQTRVGMNGRLFSMLKFRTMVKNAEALRAQLVGQNEQAGPVFKMKHDPRITTVGRFLRRYSLDELPQLFNVLWGHMSLVGPRPPIPSEVVQYDWWQRRRLSVRPGLTCIWQVSGRNSIGFEQWMQMDLAYIDGWNLALDMKIMAKTVKEVIRGGGS